MTHQPDDELRPTDPDLEARIEDRFAATPTDAPMSAEEMIADMAERVDPLAEEDEGIGAEVERVAPAISAETFTPPETLSEPTSVAISVWTLLFKPKAAARQRIDGLGRAIERHPNAPTNYVLRGELLLKLRRYAEAEMDFRRALDLAAAQVESQDWGVVAQVAQDRALAGLKQAINESL